MAMSVNVRGNKNLEEALKQYDSACVTDILLMVPTDMSKVICFPMTTNTTVRSATRRYLYHNCSVVVDNITRWMQSKGRASSDCQKH